MPVLSWSWQEGFETGPDRGLNRVAVLAAGEHEVAAGTDFHERVRSYFLDLAAQDPSRYLVLPGREDRDTIEAAIRARLEPLLP